jgi:hypothetical protein
LAPPSPLNFPSPFDDCRSREGRRLAATCALAPPSGTKRTDKSEEDSNFPRKFLSVTAQRANFHRLLLLDLAQNNNCWLDASSSIAIFICIVFFSPRNISALLIRRMPCSDRALLHSAGFSLISSFPFSRYRKNCPPGKQAGTLVFHLKKKTQANSTNLYSYLEYWLID